MSIAPANTSATWSRSDLDMSTIPYTPTVSNPVNWDSPDWGNGVHVSSTGSEMEAER